MSKASSSLLHTIRTMTGAYRQDNRTDEELLARYAETRDEQAFATLMVRHGSMVWGTCSRILGNTQDVEDACQVVLMALANKADKIKIKSVAGWLHQVAQRTALNLRKAGGSRKRMQERLKALADPKVMEKYSLDDTHSLLHEELAKLPEKLRIALVLHYLESKTEVEVAKVLGVAAEAVRMRMSRGRLLLQKRLRQRGLTVGSVALGSMLAEVNSFGSIPPGLVSKTVQAAGAFRDGKLTGGIAQFAKEVLKQAPATTPWWKTGWLIALMCVSGLGLGAGGVAWRAGFFGTDAGEEPSVAMKRPPQSVQSKLPSTRLDAYGDPLPEGSLARLGTVRFRQYCFSGGGGRVTVTTDKKLFIPAYNFVGQYHPLRCYDLATGRPITQFLDAQKQIVPLAQELVLSLDGRLLAQQIKSGENVRFWDTTSGKQLGLRMAGLPRQLALARDGDAVACIRHFDGGFDLRVLNAATGKKLWEKSEKAWPPLELLYSSDGKVLMASCRLPLNKQPASEGLLIRRWEAATGKELPSWTLDPVSAFAWSHDGDTLVVKRQFCCGIINIWDMRTGKEVRQVRLADKAEIGTISLSPNGQVLAGTSNSPQDVSLCLWNTVTGKLLYQWRSPTWAGRLTFSSDGKWLISVPADGEINRSIHVWDAASGAAVNQAWHERGHNDEVNSLVFLRQGETLASSGRGGSVVLWNEDAETHRYSMRWSERCSGDGQGTLAHLSTIAPNGKLAAYVADTELRLSETTGKVLRTFPVPCKVHKSLRFSPDNKIVALHMVDANITRILLYEKSTGKCVNEVGIPGESPAFSPNGKWLAVGGGEERGFHLLDLATSKIVASDSVGSVCDGVFSSDGRFLAVSVQLKGVHDVVCLWLVCRDGSNVRLEGPRTLVAAPPGSEFSLLTFSADGRILAAREGGWSHRAGSNAVIHLWETATGEERHRFNDQGVFATSLAFAPDNRRLASGHEDGTILLWDATGRLEMEPLSPANISQQTMTSLWADLAASDAQRAGRAVWRLAATGTSTLSFFKTRLQPVPRKNVSVETIAKLITGLDDKDFATRRKAKLELKRLSKDAEPSLRGAMEKKPSIELRHSVMELLKTIEQERISSVLSSHELRSLRAIEVLEHINRNEARQLLELLSAGDPAVRLTQEAQAALDYWKRLHQPQE